MEELKNITIDLIKIDVEMHEPQALEGMKGIIHKYKPTILIEILTDEIANEIEKIIQNIGYKYYNIDEINRPKLVKKLSKSKHCNFLICTPQIALDLNLSS